MGQISTVRERPVISPFSDWEFLEISRIVLSLAAIIRSSLDADPVGGKDTSYSAALERCVGTLVPDPEAPRNQELLDFREACNKVIHARSVDPETVLPTPPGATPPLSGRLTPHGDFRGREWRARLDLKEFALSASSLNLWRTVFLRVFKNSAISSPTLYSPNFLESVVSELRLHGFLGSPPGNGQGL